jgi:hypothetical protein
MKVIRRALFGSFDNLPKLGLADFSGHRRWTSLTFKLFDRHRKVIGATSLAYPKAPIRDGLVGQKLQKKTSSTLTSLAKLKLYLIQPDSI